MSEISNLMTTKNKFLLNTGRSYKKAFMRPTCFSHKIMGQQFASQGTV